ncbi:MAG: hypothetical protein ABI254_04235 [Chthoniobacterales bacterium]
MPDHLHLFCSPAKFPANPLGIWVKHWKSYVSLHWPHPEEGPVWQKDYWDRQLRDDEHYSDRWEYVRQNPVRAGLASDVEAWPWQGEMNVLPW